MATIHEELAAWAEAEPWCPVDTVYTNEPADPAPGGLTITFTSTGGDLPHLPGEHLGRFQVTGRGVDAWEALETCYNVMDGLEFQLPSGTWVTLTALQSVPAFLEMEDTGGERVSLNFQVDY